jgi:hypothetical protein
VTVFVFRNGLVVPKGSGRAEDVPPARSDLPAPMLSRMTPFESPVTGAEITSWRDRDRDMSAAGAVDPRDLPPVFKRGRAAQKKEVEDARKRSDDGSIRWGTLSSS